MLRIGQAQQATPTPPPPQDQTGPPPELLTALMQGEPDNPPADEAPTSRTPKYDIDKVSPEVARYLAPGSTCGTCSFFDGKGGCHLVSGPIEPEGICSLWTGQDQGQDELSPDAPPDDSAEQPSEVPTDGPEQA